MLELNHWWLTIVLGMVYAGIQAAQWSWAYRRMMPDNTDPETPRWTYVAIAGSLVAIVAMLACPVPSIQRLALLPLFLDPTILFAVFMGCAKEFKYRNL